MAAFIVDAMKENTYLRLRCSTVHLYLEKRHMVEAKLKYEAIFRSLIEDLFPRGHFVRVSRKYWLYKIGQTIRITNISLQDFLTRTHNGFSEFRNLGAVEARLWDYISNPTEELRSAFGYECSGAIIDFLWQVKEYLYSSTEEFEVAYERVVSVCADPLWNYPRNKTPQFPKLIHCIFERCFQTFGLENVILIERFIRAFPDLPERINPRLLGPTNPNNVEEFNSFAHFLDWIHHVFQTVNNSTADGVLISLEFVDYP